MIQNPRMGVGRYTIAPSNLISVSQFLKIKLLVFFKKNIGKSRKTVLFKQTESTLQRFGGVFDVCTNTLQNFCTFKQNNYFDVRRLKFGFRVYNINASNLQCFCWGLKMKLKTLQNLLNTEISVIGNVLFENGKQETTNFNIDSFH